MVGGSILGGLSDPPSLYFSVLAPAVAISDQPSTRDDEVRWLTAAGLDAEVVWARRDLAVIIAEPLERRNRRCPG